MWWLKHKCQLSDINMHCGSWKFHYSPRYESNGAAGIVLSFFFSSLFLKKLDPKKLKYFSWNESTSFTWFNSNFDEAYSYGSHWQEVSIGSCSAPNRRYAITLIVSCNNIRCHKKSRVIFLWWRHQMEKISALLAFCAGSYRSPVNSPHTKASDAELWCFLWSAPV